VRMHPMILDTINIKDTMLTFLVNVTTFSLLFVTLVR
jgi:hypothetical protein